MRGGKLSCSVAITTKRSVPPTSGLTDLVTRDGFVLISSCRPLICILELHGGRRLIRI